VARLDLALCLHNHQPVGNFEHTIENAYRQAYRPLLEAVARAPHVKLVLHYSGFLLAWLKDNHPETFDQIGDLVHGGRAELLTGGLYEPILPLIPDRDRHGQIGALTSYIERHFGTRPNGMWLAERVWQPDLVGPLQRAGVRYTIIDDNNFEAVGIEERDTLGHFTVSGPSGERVQVFPINRTLRQAVPFQSPEIVVEHLGELAGDGHRLALFADDGEKFGEWPGTHKLLYVEGWLERFLELVGENSEWLHITTVGDFLEAVPPKGEIELPPGSYAEMMEWSGGSWWGFLSRYPESNLMYRKMLAVSDAVAALPEDRTNTKEARDRLYRGQSNDPYWHGAFGGLYLLHLRAGNYRSLLRAENIARPGRTLRTDEVDFDGDGNKETLITSPQMNCYLHQVGGQIFELDYRPFVWNLLATLARRPEPYHEEQDSAEYDWYPRRALVDHFFRDDVTIDAFAACRYGEQGDFVDQPYEVEVEEGDGAMAVALRREGGVWVGDEFLPVTVSKRLSFDPQAPRVDVAYAVEHTGGDPLPLWFACELNLLLSSASGEGRYCEVDGARRPVSSRSESYSGLGALALVDEWIGFRVKLEFEEACDIWVFPIETLSHGLEGLSRSYQGTCVTPHWRIAPAAGRPWSGRFTLGLCPAEG
jgi:alpha-amylase